LDADTFTDKQIISFCEENFINLKINTDTDYGHELFDKFNGVNLPTILLLDSNGNEIDRFIGYHKPIAYLKKITDIKNNINTLEYFLGEYKLYPDSTSLALQIGNKYLQRNLDDTAKIYFEHVISGSNNKNYQEAVYRLAFLEYENGHFEKILNFIDKNPDSDFTYSAIRSMIRYYRGESDTILEVKYYEKLIDFFPTNASGLNSYGWRMSELEINLDKALIKAQLAVELSFDDPLSQAGILDTEAEILWKLGRIEEAIIIIQRSIQIDPDKDYYKEQKEKFQKSLAIHQ